MTGDGWTPRLQRELNADVDRRLGSLEAAQRGLHEELAIVMAQCHQTLDAVERILEYLQAQQQTR